MHLTTLYGEESEPLARCLLERCTVCRGGRHAVYDELLCPEAEETPQKGDRFQGVRELEEKSEEERGKAVDDNVLCIQPCEKQYV